MIKQLFTAAIVALLSVSASAQDTTYPKTMEMHNPLFADFGSQKYNSTAWGKLYTADPSAHVWGDRLYVYASHDMEPAQGCDRMDRYHVFSTDDMLNWTDHGEILNSSDLKEMGWDCDGFMWAPDCAYNPADKKYYYYFPHPTSLENWNTTWVIGVATSTDPATGFKTLGWMENVPPHIDPCTFIDDDGQPYFYVGGGGSCYGGKLKKDDWTKLDGEMQPMQGLVDFHEGTWVFKHNGKYYLMYPDNHGGDGNCMRYAMSDSPLGPWVYKSVILYPTGCDTSHGSIVDFKGKTYLFYHCCNVSGAGNLRSVCADEITYNADGTLNICKNWGTPYGGEMPSLTTNGLVIEGENFNEGGQNYAYYKKLTTDAGCDVTYRPNEANQFVFNIDDRRCALIKKNEWARYSLNVAAPGRYNIVVTARGRNSAAKFHLSLNGDKVLNTSETGNDSFTETIATDVILTKDAKYLDVRCESGYLYIDKIEIVPAAPYGGTAYSKGNHDVPGLIQAENFDCGGPGVAYYDTTPDENKGGYNYRSDSEDVGVDIENSQGSVHTSWGSSGEWLKYTINCTEDGMYDVDVNGVNGNGGSFSVNIIVDDIYIYDQVVWKGPSNWNKDSYGNATTHNVELTKGTHVVEVYLHSDGNIDYLKFTRTGDTAVKSVAANKKNTQTYNLLGQKISQDTKGIIIRDGKKVLQ